MTSQIRNDDEINKSNYMLKSPITYSYPTKQRTHFMPFYSTTYYPWRPRVHPWRRVKVHFKMYPSALLHRAQRSKFARIVMQVPMY